MDFSMLWVNIRDELGITAAFNAPSDYRLLVLLRVLRFGAFGGVGIVAARYLKLIGFKEDIIGLVFTLIMLGDLVSSFILSMVADKLGRRNVLLISSTILMLTAFVFFFSENHWVIVTAAVLGFMTPSGNEVGPFRSIEQSVVAHLIPKEQRSDCFAFYIFLGQIAAALGSIGSGFVLQILQTVFHFSEKNADKAVYLILGFLSCGMVLVCYMLSDEVELSLPIVDAEEEIRLREDIDDNSVNSMHLFEPAKETRKHKVISFLKNVAPNVDQETRLIVVKLCILFIIDTAAKSLVTKTWVSYYIKQKFNLQASELGSIFFFHDVFVAILTLVGASISRRKGVIFTMIFTHIPSIIFNTFIPMPTTVPPTVFLVLGRGAFQAMDISSKHAFVSSVVKPEQRTAVIAWTNLCRTVGQTVAPSITGYVTGLNMQWISFVLSGFLRLMYDIGLFVNFWKIRDSL